MRQVRISVLVAGLWALLLVCAQAGSEQQPAQGEQAAGAMEQDVTQGALRVEKDGAVVECPLKHTDVQATVSGFVARVKVTQTFQNPYDEKIEAVYVFPLPHKAAVDDMTMVVGERRIVGLIKRRAEARQIYEQALERGATAALLEQERPNIFTQSVGNIPPGQDVLIEISYVDVLEYDMGTYEFHFPMVVGPRYIPGSPTSTVPPVPEELKGKVGELDKSKLVEGPDQPKGTGWAPDTGRVPDASRITPPVLKPGYRTGHDISLAVSLDAGVPIQDLKVTNHEADLQQIGDRRATVKLSPRDAIPNKDFVLRYKVVGEKPEMAVLTHTDQSGGGYFMLMIQPKEDERLKQAPPRELVFLVDVSGSMSGQPTEKVKETMAKLLKLCKPQDTLQVITFRNQAQKLFEGAVPVIPENIQRAVDFTRGIEGSGGTEMLKGIKLAIDEPLDTERMRIVIMLTDGFIGNEAEIIEAVGRGCGDRIRFWCIGIGSSPNRFLLDGVARQGGGMSKVVGLNDDPTETVEDIMIRIHRAQLANIKIDWGGVDVSETYPARIPELWAGRPVILFGLYKGTEKEVTITVSGDVEGEATSWPLRVNLPRSSPDNEVLAKVWARNKIEDLMQQTYYAGSPEVEELVTSIALEYRLMSQYTSFVAVDEKDLAELKEPARPPRRMLVPVPLPEGVSYEGVFGPLGEKGYEGEAHDEANVDRLWYARPSPQPAVGLPAARPSSTRGAFARQQVKPHAGAELRLQLSPAPAMPTGGAAGSQVFFRNRIEDMPGGSYVAEALLEQSGKMQERVQACLKEAEELKKGGELLSARARLVLACMLDSALIQVGQSGGEQAASALESIEKIDKELRGAWTKELPGLAKTLDLVVRDKPLPEALEALAKAAGVEITLLSGSVEDACAVTRQTEIRISYLDLRRATVAQALDWTLQPNRMSWWVQDGKVIAGSVRRGAGASAWVYDVSLLAIPSAEEFKEAKDRETAIELLRDSADGFMAAVREALSLKEDAAAWYMPGELLQFADGETHAAAAGLFEGLADAEADVPRELRALHEVTAKRAQAGRDEKAKVLSALRRDRVASVLDSYSWSLLAAAGEGRVDLEALTELQIAWRQPEVKELSDDPHGTLVMRSCWAIAESARALPEEGELTDLAGRAQEVAAHRGEDALKTLKESPNDQTAFLSALYSVLARMDDEGYVATARPVLTLVPEGMNAGSPQAAMRVVAAALLGPATDVDAQRLTQLLAAGVQGEDMVVLAALACRRAGGEAWDAFRADAKYLMGNQPLSGGAVVLVNRLAWARLRE